MVYALLLTILLARAEESCLSDSKMCGDKCIPKAAHCEKTKYFDGRKDQDIHPVSPPEKPKNLPPGPSVLEGEKTVDGKVCRTGKPCGHKCINVLSICTENKGR